jgi:hypothetical protein
MTSLTVSPPQFFEHKGAVYPLLQAGVSFAVGSNQSLLGGTTGQVIRVMGYDVQSNTGTNGLIFLLNGSGGATRGLHWAPANTAAPFLRPVINSGYFECDVGVGLFVTISTAAVNININYFRYTP